MGITTKIVAVILNCLLLAVAGIAISEYGIPSPGEGADFVLFILMMVTPAFTIATLLLTDYGGWIILYFRRKAAEERERIEEIEGDESAQWREPER